jgi:hypothetical protein
MRILIYAETEEAKAILEEKRAEGHHASLRSTEFFDETCTESCDLVICWDSAVVHAYDGKSEVEYKGHLIDDEESEAILEDKPVTRKKATRKK